MKPQPRPGKRDELPKSRESEPVFVQWFIMALKDFRGRIEQYDRVGPAGA